jgi:hypothetical protein
MIGGIRNHLSGRSEHLNTADSSHGSLYAVRVPGGIRMNLEEPFKEHVVNVREHNMEWSL